MSVFHAPALFIGLLLVTAEGSAADASVSAPLVPPTPSVQIPPAPHNNQPPSRAWVKWLFDSMKMPIEPRHLIANIYYVGTGGVSSFLITTPQGHILLDTGFPDTVALTESSVEKLGFHLEDIKILLSSHAHIDHTGGHAEMQRRTGARVVASAKDAIILKSGGGKDYLPFPKDLIVYPPVQVDRIIGEGEQITLGGITLTAHLTPGHTQGATTWTMEVEDEGRTCHVVFFSSASINPGTRLGRNPSYPGIAEDYAATFAQLKVLPCDVFFAPHGGQFGMTEKFSRLDRGEKPNPLIDPHGWVLLRSTLEKAYREQLEAAHTLDDK